MRTSISFYYDRHGDISRAIPSFSSQKLSSKMQILPSAIYKVRNKLDHSSDSNRVTPKEAKDISKMVIELMNEVFQ